MQDDQRNPTSEVSGQAGGERGKRSDDAIPAEPVALPADDNRDPSTTIAFYRPPQLGIIHLLSWMAVTAAVMSFSQCVSWLLSSSLSGVSVVRSSATFAVSGIVQTILQAASLIGVFLLARDRLRGAPGHLQPGHWMMLGECVRLTGQMLADAIEAVLLVSKAASLGQSTTIVPAHTLRQFFVLVLVVAVYWRGAVRCPAGRLWKAVLGLNAIGGMLLLSALLAEILAGCFNWVPGLQVISFVVGACTVAYLGSVLLLVVAIVRDLRRCCRRDWLHWLGVAMALAALLLPLIFWAWAIATHG